VIQRRRGKTARRRDSTSEFPSLLSPVSFALSSREVYKRVTSYVHGIGNQGLENPKIDTAGTGKRARRLRSEQIQDKFLLIQLKEGVSSSAAHN
jgi:hypothetical protein